MATVTAATASSLEVKPLEQEFTQEVAERGFNTDQPAADRFAEKPEASGVKASLARQTDRMGKEILALAFLLGVSNIEKGALLLHVMELAAKQGLGRKPSQVKAKQQNPLVVTKNQEKTDFTTITTGAAALTAATTSKKTWQGGKSTIQPTGGSLTNRTGAAQGDQSLSVEQQAALLAAEIDENTMAANRLTLMNNALVWATLRQLQTKYPDALQRVRGHFVDEATADGGRQAEEITAMLEKIDALDGTGDKSVTTEVAENKWEQLAPMFEALRATDDPETQAAIVHTIGEQVDLNAPTNLHIVATMQLILEEKRENVRMKEDEKERRSHA